MTALIRSLRGSLDLNGHKLTVTGNLIQSGGEVKINGGELDVQGDYRLQALNNGGYVNSTGSLFKMLYLAMLDMTQKWMGAGRIGSDLPAARAVLWQPDTR